MNKGNNQWSIVVGALNTRPIADFLSQIKPIAKQIIAITIPEQDAALDAIEIKQASENLGIECKTAPTIKEALSLISQEPNLLICGSLYLAGHVLSENGTYPS